MTEKERTYLFTLNDWGASQPEMEVIWKDLDCAKIQWSEPNCIGYYPLSKTTPPAKNIRAITNLKHFSWQELRRFERR